jgi:nitrogen fixation NifU-like protein
MDQIYREQLLDHYKNPRNEGEIADTTNSAMLENLSCGDKIKVSMKVNRGKIENIKFKGEGCAICIASMSMLLDNLKGEKTDYANKLKYKDVEEMLGTKLSPSRIKCAHLGLLTVQKALKS